jgi:hypothetical protein
MEENHVTQLEKSRCENVQDKRFYALCYRIGIKEDGAPTGNGLLSRVEKLETRQEQLRLDLGKRTLGNLFKELAAYAGAVLSMIALAKVIGG